jgi:hypothetical protein
MNKKLSELKDDIIDTRWEIREADNGIKKEYVLMILQRFLKKIDEISKEAT